MSAITIDGAAIIADGTARIGSVLVEGSLITGVAYAAEDRAGLCGRAAETLPGDGHWLMPGLIDGHAHGYGSLLRGTENSLPLELWALHTTLHGRAFDAAAMRSAILLGAAEKLRAGITGTLDHSPMQALAPDALAAHEASGLRVAYAHFLHDLSDYDLLNLPLPPAVQGLVGGPPPLDADRYAHDFADLVRQARGGSGRVSVQLGPNAPQRCSPATWKLWRDLRDRHDVAVHTHLLETRAQASLNHRYPGGLVAEMARSGMLAGRLTCAHGVWLSEAEQAVLAGHGVTVSHNPASNLMLGSGVMHFAGCAACGLRLALGSDSANTGGRADVFGLMRLAMMLPRRDGITWPDAQTVFAAATQGGAAALGMGGQVGRIAPGQRADLVLVQAQAAATLARDAGLAALVQHAGPEHVRTVLVDGRIVLRDGVITAFDEAAVIREAGTQISLLQKRVAPGLAIIQANMPELMQRFLA